MYGYNGKVLMVDLTNKSFEIQDLNPEWAYTYMGGATLGARFLFDLMPAKTPVFAPESILGFVSSPLNNTKALVGARWTVVSKSPVTGGFNDANCGGSFGPALRKTGYDAIFFKGIADNPVYLLLGDGQPELRDASAIWGKTTPETEDLLKTEFGDRISVAQIGPAGEALSPMAAIMNDLHRAAGRGGPGAVMGSKRLKAVVCCGGNAEIPIKDEAALIACNKEGVNHGKPGNPGEMPFSRFSKFGTSADYYPAVTMADAPIKNWLGAPEVDITDEMASVLDGPVMDPKYRVGTTGCTNCHVRCAAYYKVESDRYKLDHVVRPEYETQASCGCALLNGCPDTMIILNWLSNAYGYDSISFGATIAWAMECYDKGIISRDEMDGIDLKWGDTDAMLAIADRMCANEGIGAVLNLATQGAAEKLGKGFECLVTACGIELPFHSSIYNPAFARTYQHDATPGRHVKGGRGMRFGHNPPEVKYNYEGTGEADVAGLLNWSLTDSCGICGFGNAVFPPLHSVKMLNAVTGFDYTQEQLVKFSYRSYTMRYAFNMREGFSRKDYTISDRAIGKPAMEAGPLKGITVDNEKLADNFFGFLGWDLETFTPPLSFLQDVGGLDFVIELFFPGQKTIS